MRVVNQNVPKFVPSLSGMSECKESDSAGHDMIQLVTHL